MRFLLNLFRRKRVTRRDLAFERMDLAIEQFRLAAEMMPPPHSRLFWDLAAAGAELRTQIVSDSASVNSLRYVLLFYMPKMSELCLRWARISQSNPLPVPDDAALEDFRDYLDMIRTAKGACLTRRYEDPHLTMDAFDQQIQRLSL